MHWKQGAEKGVFKSNTRAKETGNRDRKRNSGRRRGRESKAKITSSEAKTKYKLTKITILFKINKKNPKSHPNVVLFFCVQQFVRLNFLAEPTYFSIDIASLSIYPQLSTHTHTLTLTVHRWTSFHLAAIRESGSPQSLLRSLRTAFPSHVIAQHIHTYIN